MLMNKNIKNIVMIGNPNVGKSVVFSQLTGARVMISNYTGTTVEYTQGQLQTGGETYQVIDAPGTYSLEPTCPAEEVAVKLVEKADLVINVVDATNLERNLLLTRQLLERNVPVVVALNMIDEARRKGIQIDLCRLEELLTVPVIPTVAISGEGLKELVSALPRARAGGVEALTTAERWAEVGRLVEAVQKVTHRHHTWLESLELASLKPLTGIPLAVLVMYLTFKIVIGVGELLVGFMEDVVFARFYEPLLGQLSRFLGGGGFWHEILIGRLVGGVISLEESMGLLSTGVYVAFGVVLPYLLVFYLVLGFLEDCGYLPRLAVMVDRILHRVGLHGYAIIPTVLGFGCNVPAVLAARNLESRRERFIALTLTAVAVPCIAQTAMIFGLVGRYGGTYLSVVFATLFFVWVVLGLTLDRCLSGYTPSMVLEIPPYRLPQFKAQAKKLGLRLNHLIAHATPYIFGGILFMNILFITGVIDYLAALLSPVVSSLFGLPGESVSTFLVGFLRKDVAVAMLLPLGLSAKQFVVGATILAAYFPCAATFTILIKELGLKDMAAAAAIMIVTAGTAGTFLNLVLDTLLPPACLSLALVGLGIFLAVFAGGTSDRRELSKLESDLTAGNNRIPLDR
jgi:ferrous iron transport protein B